MTGSIIFFGSQLGESASHEDLQIIASCSGIGFGMGIGIGMVLKLILKDEFLTGLVFAFAGTGFVIGFGFGVLLAVIKNSGVV